MSKPISEWVRVVSSDQFTFIVQRETANLSGTLKSSFDPDSGFMEVGNNTCEIPHRVIVAKVLEYLAFKAQYSGATAKDFVPDFTERLEPEIALEVLMAADYLDGS
ncbi:RNA polymerase II transcription elongation factor Elongin/SIII, subunit elongin C [Phaffia rhodozyma]|uniref:Elongin-C n=1 Tax=Phaffia rhodozyma TaxID=264483 RepID=A0A0F7SSU3_PHARH|nr:RNA polymerase II transcription elongation factor Elongin/SIII, subunit elongin C [Phaffia rhodozyma]